MITADIIRRIVDRVTTRQPVTPPEGPVLDELIPHGHSITPLSAEARDTLSRAFGEEF